MIVGIIGVLVMAGFVLCYKMIVKKRQMVLEKTAEEWNSNVTRVTSVTNDNIGTPVPDQASVDIASTDQRNDEFGLDNDNDQGIEIVQAN